MVIEKFITKGKGCFGMYVIQEFQTPLIDQKAIQFSTLTMTM
jgi:hypothetical protein